MKGWLVNDCLTTIPNTETFWHYLLKWNQELEDKTGGYTDYSVLAQKIENNYMKANDKPTYIIRNGTFFRHMNIPIHQISLIQDSFLHESSLFQKQCDILQKSKCVVFNSYFMYNLYKNYVKVPYEIIPLGVDSDFFVPSKDIDSDVLPNSILFIGSSTKYPKGFDRLINIIEKMVNNNFCLIMKDNYKPPEKLKHRVKVYNRIPSVKVKQVINSCSVAVCTSYMETQHLSGIECGLCNIPIVGFPVGIYDLLRDQDGWGFTVDTVEDAIEKLNFILNNKNKFSPREVMIKNGFDLHTCCKRWQKLIKDVHS